MLYTCCKIDFHSHPTIVIIGSPRITQILCRIVVVVMGFLLNTRCSSFSVVKITDKVGSFLFVTVPEVKIDMQNKMKHFSIFCNDVCNMCQCH